MIPLTDRERQVLWLIKCAWVHCQELPTRLELTRESGMYYQDVKAALQSLHDKGFLELCPDGYDVLWWE